MAERKVGGVGEVEVLPTEIVELEDLRVHLVVEGDTLNGRLRAMPKSAPERPSVVDEKFIVDRKLRRVNAALSAARRGQSVDDAPPDGQERDAPIPLSAREEAALRVACATLSGPGGSRFIKVDVIDAEALSEEAWAVVDAIQGIDPKKAE